VVRLSREKVECVESLLQQGRTYDEIQAICGVSRATIAKISRQLQSRESRESEHQSEERAEKGRRYVGSGISEVLKALGREYANVVKHVTEKVDWFTDAVMDIGFHTIIAAFQFARIDPKEIMTKIEEFKNADEFKKHVLKYLDAMIKASAEGAERLVRLEDENRKLKALVEFLSAALEDAIEQRNKAIMYLRASIASMCEDCLRRFTLAYAMSEFVGAQRIQVQQPQAQAQVQARQAPERHEEVVAG